MREDHPAVPHLDEAVDLGLVERRDVRRARRCGRGEETEVAFTVRGDEEHELPGRGAERRRAPGDDRLYPRTGRQRQVERRAAGPLRGRQRRGQLTSASGLPAAASTRAAATDATISGATSSRTARADSTDSGPTCRTGRRVPSAVFRVTGGEDERHPTCGPPGREPDALVGRGIEPLDVVDDDQNRPVVGRDAEQADRRDAHRQPVARRRRPQCQRRPERIRLRRRKFPQPTQHRGEQVRQRGEREIGLGLHTRSPQDGHVVTAAAHQLVEQGSLPDPGLTAQQEGASVSVPQLGQQLAEPDQLVVAPFQHEL